MQPSDNDTRSRISALLQVACFSSGGSGPQVLSFACNFQLKKSSYSIHSCELVNESRLNHVKFMTLSLSFSLFLPLPLSTPMAASLAFRHQNASEEPESRLHEITRRESLDNSTFRGLGSLLCFIGSSAIFHAAFTPSLHVTESALQTGLVRQNL